ncbi:GGDEF domain-containing phosphodiesterase [Asanoa sp. WMMD1127]|uniref:putative bifunctional diguanylate cyclase/phosphodiesterase n=1 Tax=Asanoa sp. WMMD1127 TaxID=3016107 RepID=UPI0024159825|nr:GGDEF domain-containing phosphodiesterase [Asanoa sp. WMMD1127]MDG4824965.1 GGDEF domain-containing phosphodiesterase [Asanoa sp. WMMD1127]
MFLSTCFSFGILLVWGLGPALAVQATANLVGCARLRLSPWESAIVLVRNAAGIGAAGGLLLATGVGPLRRAEGVDGSMIGQVVVAVLAALLVSYGILVIADRFATGRPWHTSFTRGLGLNVLASASLLFLGPVIVAEPRGWTFALLLLPIGALTGMVRLIDRQNRALRRDALTGVLSQRGLDEVVNRMLGRDDARSEPVEFAFLLFHGARLRDISESYGRRIGDRIVMEIARRLRSAVGPQDAVGRLEGNEFGIVHAGRRDADAAVAVARTTVASLEEPAVVAGVPFDIRGTVGIALAPEHGADLTTIVRHADSAAHEAARAGVPALVYTPAPVSDPARRLEILRDLSATLDGRSGGGTISFVYQPQVDLASGELASVEALLRWQHPRRGAVDTGTIVEVAEPTALMGRITERAVEEVTAQLRRWNAEHRPIAAAVNVSMRDLQRSGFVDHLLATVAGGGIRPDQLTVEITEGELISEAGHVERAVARIADAGIGLAADDFGTGFSSLQHLRRLALTEVKIDKSLVGGIADRRDDRALVRSVIEMAATLGLRVVAEGVEDERTHQVLLDLGCPTAQGWYYGRPRTAAGISDWIGGERVG